MTHPGTIGRTSAGPLPIDIIQRGCLFLMIASSWFVIVEPSPYELLFVVTLLMYLAGGLKATMSLAPLILFLVLYNLGGAFSVLPVLYIRDAVWFTIISVYMGATAIFFAFAVLQDPMGTMRVIRTAWVIAGLIGAVNGIIGYFDIAGMGAAWAPISRAQGTFKDPNVLATFLIPPALFIIQDILLGRTRWVIVTIPVLGVIMAGLFLAFSRGAWINFMAAALVMVGLLFVLTPSLRLRSRIVLYFISGVLATAALLSFALSFEAVRDVFLIRFSFHQSYDVGETGRFGNQLNFIPTALVSPNGIGPHQFSAIYGEDPHNVFLNAFASYGWLGGFSYLLLCIATICAGWRAIFSRTPWQAHALAVFPPMLTVILQGVQIDTDHWRHFYLLLGLTWGLYAATVTHRRAADEQDAF